MPSHQRNPRIAFGVFLLSTYPSVRPKELVNVDEGDWDLQKGYLKIRKPKGRRGQRKAKRIPLLEEDVELVKSLFPTAINPDLPFFRHKNGKRFADDMFWKWWVRACANLKIEGVDLYGGTKTTSTTESEEQDVLEEFEKELQAATMHQTDDAFRHYRKPKEDRLRRIYRSMRPAWSGGKPVVSPKRPVKKT